jgi:hypothetical protein
MAAVVAVDTESITLAGAFLLGAVFATVATLRVVKAVTNFFAGYSRPRRPRDDPDD